MKTNVAETVFEILEKQERVHHDYNHQKRLLDEIRQGNAGGVRTVFAEIWNEPHGVLARDELRSCKNFGIVWVAMFGQTAIEGSLNSEWAFSLMDGFICQIEELNSKEAVFVLLQEAGVLFANLVEDRKKLLQGKQAHLLVERCENLIFSRLHEKITVKELADTLSVNPDYLSRLFHEQRGITVVDFIQREKIALARNLLIYSEYTLEKISYYLGFSSQSHFGKVFKRITQMSPGNYRKKYAVYGSFRET